MTAAVWDAGLQNERTSLAWSRSALSVLGVGLLTARLAVAWHWAPATATALLAVACCGALQRVSRKRYTRASEALFDARPLPDGRQAAALVACLVAFGLLAIALIGGRLLWGTSAG